MATKEEKELVLARLETFPPNLRLSIGAETGKSGLTKAEIIKHVEDDDRIGEMIINVYMHYLRSFKG